MREYTKSLWTCEVRQGTVSACVYGKSCRRVGGHFCRVQESVLRSHWRWGEGKCWKRGDKIASIWGKASLSPPGGKQTWPLSTCPPRSLSWAWFSSTSGAGGLSLACAPRGLRQSGLALGTLPRGDRTCWRRGKVPGYSLHLPQVSEQSKTKADTEWSSVAGRWSGDLKGGTYNKVSENIIFWS